ncbi:MULTISPECIES: protein phosphatase CheZ [unclassified Motilimonas]|uniref:protein phosphatase CheZ n=1 Tax=Motilimonas TaxID=1914248 RepID=UPI001E44ECD2|nr:MULTISPECIES: protein phosphatase CheZ [unclassified Motilimonas]MCE0556255.1 protein phosphatase CheZ [Motilimonas sp. E26]MDO6524995.1 protein phosphatase CheZ [Motilimonas sp. 1_MG-2023]
MTSTNEALLSLEQAQHLVELLKLGEVAQANSLISGVLSDPSKNELFEQVGLLTRQLHDSLIDFQNDNRLSELANSEIPDAKDRLTYVIEMTDKAANRTMDAVDESLPLADRLNENIQQVLPGWNSLMNREIELVQFKELCHKLDKILKDSEQDADKLKHLLTEILMAQDFQDLTGQMIRRVITLVQEVEVKLVEMLTMFGEFEQKPKQSSTDAPRISGIEAEGPIMNAESRDDVVSGQDDVDDLLSSLGF